MVRSALSRIPTSLARLLFPRDGGGTPARARNHTVESSYSVSPRRFVAPQPGVERTRTTAMWATFAMTGLAAALVGGCSMWRLSTPTQPVLHPFAAISTEQARVCVVRTSRLAQDISFPTYDNDKLVGVTRGPTFFCYFADPGEHELRIRADTTTSVILHAEAGKSYYLHQQIPFPAFTTECEAVWVDATRARELIDDAQYEIVTEAPDFEKVPEQPPVAEARTTLTGLKKHRPAPPPPPVRPEPVERHRTRSTLPAETASSVDDD